MASIDSHWPSSVLSAEGDVFDLLRDDVAAVAAMQGMEGVFNLRGADIYRVLDIEVVPGARFDDPEAACRCVGRPVCSRVIGRNELPPKSLRGS